MSSAAFAYPHKSAEAFRTISEVALELDVPQHVLRFWESRFVQIKPVKRAGGRRYYRPEDVDLLKGIRALLYSDGLTIKGVQKVLKERGLRHVAVLGRGGAPEPVSHEPVVIEKIVYVEKPVAVAPPKKSRPSHLRAVSAAMSLPLFDEPQPLRDLAALDKALSSRRIEEPEAELAAEPVTEDLKVEFFAAEERERLEELLDELLVLKERLWTARGEARRA
jgi:DNA-binding transcriptional MerR regulator